MQWHSVCTERMPASDAVLRDKHRHWEDAVAPEWPRHIRQKVCDAEGSLRSMPSPKGFDRSRDYSPLAASDWSVPDNEVLARPLADNTWQEAKSLKQRMERLEELYHMVERQRREDEERNKLHELQRQKKRIDGLDLPGELKSSLFEFMIGCVQLQTLCREASFLCNE